MHVFTELKLLGITTVFTGFSTAFWKHFSLHFPFVTVTQHMSTLPKIISKGQNSPRCFIHLVSEVLLTWFQINGFCFMLKLTYFYHGPCGWWRGTPLIKDFDILAPQTDHCSCRLLNQSLPMRDVHQVILPEHFLFLVWRKLPADSHLLYWEMLIGFVVSQPVSNIHITKLVGNIITVDQQR